MRAFSAVSAVIILAANTWAATIVQPAMGTVWEASAQAQSVAWTSVPTDPSSFALMLANNVVYPNVNILLKSNVSTAAGSTTVPGPSTGWPTGDGFQINVVQQNPTGTAILAQSQQFSINGTTTPFSSSSLPSSRTSTGTTPDSTSTSTSKNGGLGLTVQTGFVAGLTLVGALLV